MKICLRRQKTSSYVHDEAIPTRVTLIKSCPRIDQFFFDKRLLANIFRDDAVLKHLIVVVSC